MPCTSREGRPIPSPRRRRLGLALAGAATLCATPAWPQTAAAKPKIAVVSAIGDVLTVVTYTPSVGSRVNRNAQETLPLADALFDVIALKAVAREIGRAAPGTPVVSLTLPSSPTEPGDRLQLDAQRYTPTGGLKTVLEQEAPSRLLLLTRLRAPARLETAHGTFGSGTLEGLGFYLDRSIGARNLETGESSPGFLAPYAYFRLTLVDLPAGAVRKSVDITAGYIMANPATSDSTHPWDALSPQGKVDALGGLLNRQLARAIPEMLP